MNYDYAPMEGVTIALYRNIHREIFPEVDRYFSPFLSPNNGVRFKKKQMDDILPEYNKSITLIPQLLTNDTQDFIRTAQEFEELGYEEVNLNLGCPSGTVVAKKKGSGFLAHPVQLDKFLYEIFEKTKIQISIKTRLGKEEIDEFDQLMKIYNQYKIKELIVHPRIQQDMYKNKPHMDRFKDAVLMSKNPIAYNGDVFTAQDCKKIEEEFPKLSSIMIGRGLITNPALVREIKTGKALEKKELEQLHEALYHAYEERMSGHIHLLYRMKEYWHYMIHAFPEGAKIGKKIKKTRNIQEYEMLVKQLFENYEVGGSFNPYQR